MENNNTNNILITKKMFVTMIALGMIFGVVLHHFLSSTTKQILYVSEEEILALENERISHKKYENRDLFFGKSKEVSKRIINLANSLKTKDTYIVFSKGKVFGDNVRSISEDIHNAIVEELEKNE